MEFLSKIKILFDCFCNQFLQKMKRYKQNSFLFLHKLFINLDFIIFSLRENFNINIELNMLLDDEDKNSMIHN